jgi:hypothetical protein
LTHGFRVLVNDCLVPSFGPVLGQSIMVGSECGAAKLLTSWWPGSKERERRSEGLFPLLGIPPLTLLPLTRPHLIKVAPAPNSL